MKVVYCANGHYIGSFTRKARSWQEFQRLAMEERDEDAPHRALFCGTCGAQNIHVCENCNKDITAIHDIVRPSYCVGCGKPYPWTEAALLAAREFTDELEELSPEEKATLKQAMNEMTSDTARTPLAESRFKKLVAKIGPTAAQGLGKIVMMVATEEVKRHLGIL